MAVTAKKSRSLFSLLVKTALLISCAGVCLWTYGAPDLSDTSLSTCQAKAVNNGTWEEFATFERWCSQNVWAVDSEEESSMMTAAYLWFFQARVDKCKAYTDCSFDNTCRRLGLIFLSVIFLADYLYTIFIHGVRERKSQQDELAVAMDRMEKGELVKEEEAERPRYPAILIQTTLNAEHFACGDDDLPLD